MHAFRMSWRNGPHRGAQWVEAEDVDAAIYQLREAHHAPDLTITSITKCCGAPNRHKRHGGTRYGTCQRLTYDERCHQHRRGV